MKYTSLYDRVFTCLHNSSLRLIRHIFLITLRWWIKQILLYFKKSVNKNQKVVRLEKKHLKCRKLKVQKNRHDFLLDRMQCDRFIYRQLATGRSLDDGSCRDESIFFIASFSHRKSTLPKMGNFLATIRRKVNLPKMGKCYTIVGQSVWLRHCYWLSCLTYVTRQSTWTHSAFRKSSSTQCLRWSSLYNRIQIACKRLTVNNFCRKLEDDTCRQVLRIVGSWHVNFVLFCFDGGQVPQRCLVSKFMSSIKCFDLFTTSAHTTRSRLFLANAKF